jgi:flagella basal body P-ring formation protein FlgA
MRKMARPAVLVLLVGLWAAQMGSAAAWADGVAALRLQVQLDAGVIKVGDLWTNAGTKSDAVVGPAPPPGRAIAIETGQLAYIARLFDVDWRPVSGVERTSVERAGRPLSREEAAEPLRRNLVEAGAGESGTVELANFAAILVPPASFPLIAVEAMAYDPGSDRFSASLVVSGPDMPTQRMRVAGRILHMTTAVIATRRLQAGEVIGAADVRAAQVPERRLAGPVLGDVALAVGQAPRRTIVAGQPLTATDIGPPVMVAKGDTVVVVLDTPGIYLAAQGVSLSAGGHDDVIQVMNPLSRAVVAARVVGPGRAVIAPGSTPLVAPAAAPPRSPEIAN